MKDNEFPNALRVIADKLDNGFEQNIHECANDLYEISVDLTMGKEELLGQKLQPFINDIADFSNELMWRK